MSGTSAVRTVGRTALAAAAVYGTWAVLRRAEEREQNASVAQGKRFLVLGSGFAGTAVAEELARLLPGADNGEILLIDTNNYLLFTPMLTEAAGGELDPRHIVSPVRRMNARVNFVQGRITAIDLVTRTVQVQAGAGSLEPVPRSYSGDHLVIALGSVVSYHGLPGIEEHSIGMKRLEHATQAFHRVSTCLEQASIEDDPAKRRELLTFVVGGGGYTGVETMAAINDLVRTEVERVPTLQPSEVRTLLVHPGDKLLPEITDDLGRYTLEKLKERGVEVRLNTSINSAGEDFVEIGKGERIPTRTLIWAAGVTPNPLLANLPAQHGKHHGLTVGSDCQLPEHPGVWALGDCAEIPEPDGKGTYAPTAQNATREGTVVAQNIVRTLHGKATEPFRFTPIGELALVGRRTGVARVYGYNFSGFIAWAMWRAIYLAKMPNIGQQGRILSDWILDVVFGRSPAPLSSTDTKGPFSA